MGTVPVADESEIIAAMSNNIPVRSGIAVVVHSNAQSVLTVDV